MDIEEEDGENGLDDDEDDDEKGSEELILKRVGEMGENSELDEGIVGNCDEVLDGDETDTNGEDVMDDVEENGDVTAENDAEGDSILGGDIIAEN